MLKDQGSDLLLQPVGVIFLFKVETVVNRDNSSFKISSLDLGKAAIN